MTKRIIKADAPINELLGKLEEDEPTKQSTAPKAEAKAEEPKLSRRTPSKDNRPKRETKTARVQLVLKPSLVEAMKAKCKTLDMSVNDYVSQLIEISLEE